MFELYYFLRKPYTVFKNTVHQRQKGKHARKYKRKREARRITGFELTWFVEETKDRFACNRFGRVIRISREFVSRSKMDYRACQSPLRLRLYWSVGQTERLYCIPAVRRDRICRYTERQGHRLQQDVVEIFAEISMKYQRARWSVIWETCWSHFVLSFKFVDTRRLPNNTGQTVIRLKASSVLEHDLWIPRLCVTQAP